MAVPAPLVVVILDFESTKLNIPSVYLRPTEALYRLIPTPTVCRLFQRGQCHQGPRCRQAHIDPKYLAFARQQISACPPCCLHHVALSPNFSPFVYIQGWTYEEQSLVLHHPSVAKGLALYDGSTLCGTIAWEHVLPTLGIRRLLMSAVGGFQEATEVPQAGPSFCAPLEVVHDERHTMVVHLTDLCYNHIAHLLLACCDRPQCTTTSISKADRSITPQPLADPQQQKQRLLVTGFLSKIQSLGASPASFTVTPLSPCCRFGPECKFVHLCAVELLRMLPAIIASIGARDDSTSIATVGMTSCHARTTRPAGPHNHVASPLERSAAAPPPHPHTSQHLDPIRFVKLNTSHHHHGNVAPTPCNASYSLFQQIAPMNNNTTPVMVGIPLPSSLHQQHQQAIIPPCRDDLPNALTGPTNGIASFSSNGSPTPSTVGSSPCTSSNMHSVAMSPPALPSFSAPHSTQDASSDNRRDMLIIQSLGIAAPALSALENQHSIKSAEHQHRHRQRRRNNPYGALGCQQRQWPTLHPKDEEICDLGGSYNSVSIDHHSPPPLPQVQQPRVHIQDQRTLLSSPYAANLSSCAKAIHENGLRGFPIHELQQSTAAVAAVPHHHHHHHQFRASLQTHRHHHYRANAVLGPQTEAERKATVMFRDAQRCIQEEGGSEIAIM